MTDMTKDAMTPCCEHPIAGPNGCPVFWNEGNKVLQCHACGEVYEPALSRPDPAQTSAEVDVRRHGDGWYERRINDLHKAKMYSAAAYLHEALKDMKAQAAEISDLKHDLERQMDIAKAEIAERDALTQRVEALEAGLAAAVNEMEQVDIFVNSREKIKQPEGRECYRAAIDRARALLNKETNDDDDA